MKYVKYARMHVGKDNVFMFGAALFEESIAAPVILTFCKHSGWTDLAPPSPRGLFAPRSRSSSMHPSGRINSAFLTALGLADEGKCSSPLGVAVQCRMSPPQLQVYVTGWRRADFVCISLALNVNSPQGTETGTGLETLCPHLGTALSRPGQLCRAPPVAE